MSKRNGGEGSKSVLDSLAETLDPGPFASRQFLVISLYLDVSGHADQSVMTAGAYLATQQQWRRFRKKWGALLWEAGVKQFHATDFYGCHKEFKDWERNSPKQNDFARRFSEAAADYTEIGFAVGIDPARYEALISDVLNQAKTPHGRFTPEMFCIAVCLNHAARRGLIPHNKTAAVVLEDGRGMGEVIEYLNIMKRAGEPAMSAYTSVTTMDKSELALQAADLLAHESWRRIKEALKPEGRDIRKPMKNLLRYGMVQVKMFTDADLKTSALSMAKFLDENPHYHR